jgi:uncharacterized protein YjdB
MKSDLYLKSKCCNSQILPLLALVLAMFFSQALAGKNYYFSTSTGDDSRTALQAQSPATPWKTIAKLNSYFTLLAAGDSVLFKRNEAFYGSIKVRKSGISTRPIVLGAYGIGSKPVIDGFTTLSAWTASGNGIFQCAAAACSPKVNMVTVNGTQKALGRYPNTGYLSFENSVDTTSITDNELPGTPNWTGAEVVIRKRHWVIDRNSISSHSGHTIQYKSGSAYFGVNGYGYFIQGDIKTLDQMGEWYFNPASKLMSMYFGSNNPSAYSIKASTVDTLVYLYGINYITFDNLAFQGANVAAFYIYSGQYIRIQNCSIDFSGTDGIRVIGSPYFLLENSVINHSNNQGINSASIYSTIRRNTIKNSGMIPGMGKSGDGSQQAINASSSNGLIEYNTIDSTGYIAISVSGNLMTLKNNFINYFLCVKDDGGGIYTGDLSTNRSKQIVGNILVNGIGNSEGAPNMGYHRAHGIYIEGNPKNVEISSNTIANCAYAGIYLHFTQLTNVRGNTLFNNGVQMLMSYGDLAHTPIRTTNLRKNIFFSKYVSQEALEFNSIANDLALFGSADSNYYCRPLDDNFLFYTTYIQSGKSYWNSYNLPLWSAAFNQDQHSSKSPVTINEYTLNGIIGSDKITNGTFNTNITGFGGVNCVRKWDNAGILDAGCLQLSPGSPSPTSDLSYITANIGPVSASKNYILRFTAKGTNPSAVIGCYLRQLINPWYPLTATRYIKVTNTRAEYEVLLSFPVSENNATLNFNFKEGDGILWLDNIHLYEADLTLTNPDEYIRFEFNATNSNKTIALDFPYVGLNGTAYTNSITLLPYTSAVLIKSQNQPPLIQNQSFQVMKTSPNGTFVGKVLASDPNTNQILTYSILMGNSNGAFSINGMTGDLTVANSAALDLLTAPSQVLVVNVQDNGLGFLSSQANITINVLSTAGCGAVGNISYQVWNNIGPGTAVSNLTSSINYPNNPSSTSLLTSMEAPSNFSNSFGSRIAGFVCAPATGGYTFWIAADDNTELWLSTNNQPANKQKIAYHTFWTNTREWNKYTTQKSAVINLIQGQSYYIEALMKDGSSGPDNMAIGWLKPGQTGYIPSEVIPGSVLSPIGTTQNVFVTSVSLPDNVTINAGSTVTISATIFPEDASNNTLLWDSSDTTVAVVNNNGLVAGLSAGNATITATTTDGSNMFGTCQVTVLVPPCNASGNITYQAWTNIGSGTAVSYLTNSTNYPNNPTSSFLLTSMEAPSNYSNSFGARIAGYICAPVTGSYFFWIAADDNTELWLSTNDQPTNKQKIAYHTFWTYSRQWNKYTTQKSAAISLIQGQTYYIEALMKDGSSGPDNMAVGWLKPGESGTVPSEVIPGFVLSPIGTTQTILVSSVSLPANATVNLGSTVTLSASVLPANATNSLLNWSSSNTDVAIVNNSGVVTAVSAGISVITATAADGSNMSATCLLLVVDPPCVASGNITYETWNTIGPGTAIINLTSSPNYPNYPSTSSLLTSLEAPGNYSNSFGARISGYICAPVSGNYTFWIAADDNTELWLSTDDQAVNKQKIAYHMFWTYPREWNKYSTQRSAVINLIQGQSYYIEALMKDGSNGPDNMAVGWLKPGQTGTSPSEVIPGSVLSSIGNKSVSATSQNPVIDDITESGLGIKLSVYPNPLFENKLNLKLENLSSSATLEIYTVSGVACFRGQISASGTIDIERSVFNNGIYIIKAFNDQFIKTVKLVVR